MRKDDSIWNYEAAKAFRFGFLFGAAWLGLIIMMCKFIEHLKIF